MSNDSLSPAASAEHEAPLDLGFWRRDPVLLAGLGAWILVLAPYAVYLDGGGLPIWYRNGATFALLAAVVAFGSFADLGAVRPLAWRRLRVLVGAAFVTWALIELWELRFSGGSQGATSAFRDSLWIFFYVLFGFAALDDRRIGEAAEASRLRQLRRAETALFVVGMFVYFVIIPIRFDRSAVGSTLPSAFLYVALDGFLLGLFARRLLRAGSPAEVLRWRLFVLAAALFLLTDALFFYSLTDRLDLESHPLADLLWYTPYLAALFAVRVPAAQAGDSGKIALDTSEPVPAPFAPSFLYAALVPVAHLVAEATGVASSQAAGEQRGFALALTLLLGSIATLHQRRIAQLQERLRQEVVDVRRRLAAAQKLDAIGRLSAGVAHDFNNLLTVILGRAELSRDRAGSPELRRDLDTIVRTAGRAAELTQELLAVGQRGMGVRQRLDLGALVGASLPELGGICGEAIVIEAELAPTALTVEIDPSHLERVLRNLASNARDAMPGGGRLTIATARRAVEVTRRLRDGELPAGDYASLVFHDTGSGMDEETQRRLFEPFFTTKGLGHGTGLGLATAYGLVRQNGGEIAVSSRPGAGARFEVLLPIAAAEPPRGPAGG